MASKARMALLGKRGIAILLFVGAALRLSIDLNLPLSILTYLVHDDAWFIQRAIYIISGKWFGSYDQYTLMKGPGYPIFLAVSNISGMPISASHSLFQIVSIYVTGWAVWRLSRSLLIGAFCIFLLLLYPVGFLPELQRVIRDQIYWGQTLIIFSVFSILFFAPPGKRWAAILLSVIVGSVFGWAWLTREEGVWLIPGLCFLVICAIIISRKDKQALIERAISLVVIVIMVYSVNGAFMMVNRIVYGSFIGVDFKESGFVSASNALQKIEPEPAIPFLPVPSNEIRKAGKVSKIFAPISEALTPGGSVWGWNRFGCDIYPKTCGKGIAGGWFLWALRDAAAKNGFYSNPGNASYKFSQIAADVDAACERGELKCGVIWINFMPKMSKDQWWSLPRSLVAVASKVAFLDPPRSTSGLQTASSDTNSAVGRRYWAFLNFPLVKSESSIVSINGWYFDSKTNAWPVFKVFDQGGVELPITSLVRRASPDLQKAFSDDRAALNRIEATFSCPNICTISSLREEGRPVLEVRITSAGPLTAGEGAARLYIDKADVEWQGEGPAKRAALWIRVGLVEIFRILSPLLICAGLFSVAWTVLCAFNARISWPLLAVSLAGWILVGTRIVILALINVSSFPAANLHYCAPAAYLALLCALLSIAAYRAVRA